MVSKTFFSAECLFKLAASPHQRCASSYKFRSGRTCVANNTIAYATSRVINSLNRVSAITSGQGANQGTTQYGYDANGYLYAEANPLTYIDPLGLWGVADLPSIPQPVVDFGAGMGDTILLGQGPRIRDALGVDGGVDQCSDAYDYGEWAGIGASLATGFAGGVRAAGVKGAGKEFSHWIPNRMGGPRTIFNGNYVPTATHAVSDPYRYRFMPRAWKAANPPMSGPMSQWTRIPNVYKGTAAGGAYGAAGAAQTGCSCRR